MKVSYLNNILYRILIPPVVSVLVYLLMLLVFDRLSEISNNFSPEELIFLMFVTFFLFESYRFWIRKIENINYLANRLLIRSLFLYLGSLLITFLVVFLCISLYYRYYIGLSNFSAELTSFLIVFVLVGILFHLFYLSIRFLDSQSSFLLKKEEINRQNIEFELEVFKNKLNPEFLYESLESVICMIRKNDVECAEEHIDNLALFYRKIIGSRYSEVVSLDEEKMKVNNYLKIRNYRYSNNFIVNWKLMSGKEINVVPNMILQIIQLIEYCQMLGSNIKLEIDVMENENYLIFEFASSEKLIPLSKINLRKQTIQKTIGFYSDLKLKWEILNEQTQVFIPKINLEEY